MSIHTRKNKGGNVTYTVAYRVDGEQRRDSFSDWKAAQRYELQVKRIGGERAREMLLSRGKAATASVPLLSEWLERYVTNSTGVTAGTRADYARLANRTWLPYLGEIPVDAVTRDDVAAWVNKQAATETVRGQLTSAKTIANAHGLLSSVMTYAVESNVRPDNPCRGLRLPRGEAHQEVFLTKDEFWRIVDAAPEHWRPLIVTLGMTGMRWGEATALTWSDVDFGGRRTITISKAWKKGPGAGVTRELGATKTRRSNRTLRMPQEVVDALQPLRQGPDDRVFVGLRGGDVLHQNFYPRVWLPTVAKADLGKHVRIHDLRHSCASWLIAAGVPLMNVQRQLGHESIQTSANVYGHLAPDAFDIAADALSATLGRGLPALEGDLVLEGEVID